MRKIKFRGLGRDDYKFYYGSVAFNYNGFPILLIPRINGTVDRIFVHPETVGQYTEIKDRDGTEIFEGDILSVINGSINSKPWPQKNITVKIEKGGTNLPNWIRNEIWDSTHFVKVIGNIHENPELLK